MHNWRLKPTEDRPDTPVTVAEVKDQARVDTSASDAYITRLIDAVTDAIEGPYGIGIVLVQRTWEMKLDGFWNLAIEIPIYPIQSVEAVKYLDENGTEQTLATSVYRVDTYTNPPNISLEWNQQWPSARWVRNSVTIEFTAGYALASGSDYRKNIPEDLRQAILLWCAHLYDNRSAVVVGTNATEMPMGVAAILDRYRVPAVG